ncbi:MAG: hypothetical protein HS116_22100 [Planctomycetes bacterium]|nr:hypothetical protein [Planctomycetota bacterium]
MNRETNGEGRTIPRAEDGVELQFRPDLGADVYVHPATEHVYLDTGTGRFQRTERLARELKRQAPAADPGLDFPTERPQGRAKYGVDLSAEGYA